MMINTHPYSNMTPQHDTFNRYTWERLEKRVRIWTEKRGDLYVSSGAIFDLDGNGARDSDSAARRVPPRNRVAIPTHFYKIIFKKKTFGASDSIAILLPHDDTKHTGKAWEPYVTSHITSIGANEQLTGISFLPNVTGSKRIDMQNYRAPALWPKK